MSDDPISRREFGVSVVKVGLGALIGGVGGGALAVHQRNKKPQVTTRPPPSQKNTPPPPPPKKEQVEVVFANGAAGGAIVGATAVVVLEKALKHDGPRTHRDVGINLEWERRQGYIRDGEKQRNDDEHHR